MEIDWKLKEADGGLAVEVAIHFPGPTLTVDDLEGITAWLRETRDRFETTETKPEKAEQAPVQPRVKTPKERKTLVTRTPVSKLAEPPNGKPTQPAAGKTTQERVSHTDKIRNFLAGSSGASTPRIAAETGVSYGTTGALLSQMVKAGKVRRVGEETYKGRTLQTYALVEAEPEQAGS